MPERKVGGICRDQYFDGYMDYLTERTAKERKASGKAPYSAVTIRTMATDTFYLEKHDDKPFTDWLKDDDTMHAAETCLIKCLSGRHNPERDARYYVNMMQLFRDYLATL